MTDTQRNDTMPPDIEAYHMGIHAKKMLVIPINGATRTHCGFCKYRDGVHGVCLLFGRNLGREDNFPQGRIDDTVPLGDFRRLYECIDLEETHPLEPSCHPSTK